MKTPVILFAIVTAFTVSAIRAQSLEHAEVRIPYSELKQLLTRAEPVSKKPMPNPALLSARLRIVLENRQQILEITFRTIAFGNDTALVPLVSGDVTLDTLDPQDAPIITEKNQLCLVNDKAGIHTLKLRLLPSLTKEGFQLCIPPCPSVILETQGLPAGHSVVIHTSDSEFSLNNDMVHPLPGDGKTLMIRMLNDNETLEAMRPPEPSTWTWQHQALVKPADGDLIYQIISRASAPDGSGLEARLPLPQDALDISVSGEDIASYTKTRGRNRSQELAIVWKNRGILDRQIMISYRMPLRPLDTVWHLEAPSGDGTRTRFIIANSATLAYAAEGLSGVAYSAGLPPLFVDSLHGNTCQHLESGHAVDLKITTIPVAATAEGVIRTADWFLKIEPDGALLISGSLAIENESPLGFQFDTPEGMKLLSCDIEGKSVSPVDLGAGLLKVTLPASVKATTLNCSFTGRVAELDPVEGTLKLTLPKIPLFIHSLAWSLHLPVGYQAETHGNLKRVTAEQPSRIVLTKNLCRDERPEVQVFYQRSDLNR